MTKNIPMLWGLSVQISYIPALSVFLSTIYTTTEALLAPWGNKPLAF